MILSPDWKKSEVAKDSKRKIKNRVSLKSVQWLKENRKCVLNKKMKSLVIENFILDSRFFSSLTSTSTVCRSAPLRSANTSLSKAHSADLTRRGRWCTEGREVRGRHQMHSDLRPVSGDINNFSGAVIVRGDAQTEDQDQRAEPAVIRSDPACSLRRIKRCAAAAPGLLFWKQQQQGGLNKSKKKKKKKTVGKERHDVNSVLWLVVKLNLAWSGPVRSGLVWSGWIRSSLI